MLFAYMKENTPLMKRAAALIARRTYSRGELRRKLTFAQKMEDAGEIEAVLNRFEHLNLINDAKYAYDFVSCRLNGSGWGEKKIRMALLAKDIAGSIADQAICRVREDLAQGGENDGLVEYIEDYYRKHGTPSTLKDARKLARHLAGRGFGEERILDVLQRVVSPEIFRHLRTGDYFD